MSNSMNKNKKPLVPNLRFPEFRDAREWEKTTIGEIGSFYYGKSAPKWSLEENAPTQCVRYGELYTKFGAVITETYSRTNIDPSNLRFSKGGEILVPRVGEKPDDFGKCCCYLPLGNIAIGEMISVFETAQNPLFYTYYFRNMYREFAKVVEGQNVKNLYYVELEPLAICRPSLPEQQKIADCLSSLDALIAAQSEKFDALKTHKKGLMQQLFPREGETVPRMRFPEFRDAGEWGLKILGEVSDVRDGTHDSPKFNNKGRPLVTSKNLLPNGGLDLQNVNFISEQDYEQINRRSEVSIGDILFGMIGTVGNPVMVKTDGFAIKNVALIKQKNELLNSYLVQFLNSQYIAREFSILNAGNIQKFIALGNIRKLSFPTPELSEQQKIADCLSSLDTLIAAQAEKLDALNTHKKGLMQQLFPRPKAVDA